jgi:hypothetical protein
VGLPETTPDFCGLDAHIRLNDNLRKSQDAFNHFLGNRPTRTTRLEGGILGAGRDRSE